MPRIAWGAGARFRAEPIGIRPTFASVVTAVIAPSPHAAYPPRGLRSSTNGRHELSTREEAGMLRILVADPELLAAMERERWFLHPARYAVGRATSGAEAIVQARKARPDLLVASMTLPDGGGSALTRQIRSIPGCSELPVILSVDAAAAVNPQVRQKAAAAGIQAILARPVTRGDFFGAVRRVALPTGAPTVRVPVAAPAMVATAAGSVPGQALNLSRGGIYVAVDQPPAPGSRVRVGLTLPRFTNPITLPGEVRWVNPPGPGAGGDGAAEERLPPGVGVEFRELPPLVQSTLNLFILSSPRAVQL